MKKLLILTMVMGLSTMSPGFLRAEERVVGQEAQRLKELRTENPEEFKRVVQEKKEKMRERLEHLKQSDPQAYEQFMQNHPQWAQRQDRDGNPPGAVGGQGTNWENRPGPQGGRGASPDKGRGGRRGR